MHGCCCAQVLSDLDNWRWGRAAGWACIPAGGHIAGKCAHQGKELQHHYKRPCPANDRVRAAVRDQEGRHQGHLSCVVRLQHELMRRQDACVVRQEMRMCTVWVTGNNQTALHRLCLQIWTCKLRSAGARHSRGVIELWRHWAFCPLPGPLMLATPVHPICEE